MTDTPIETSPILEQFTPIPKKSSRYISYTAPGYEAGPDEWDDVHMEIEKREFDSETGEKKSKPRKEIINSKQFPSWYASRKALGFSINKVLHRPADVEPFEADPWKRNY